MSADALSDGELRSKLMEYGYPVDPVTQTTRKILLKKLKNLMETRGGTESRHSLTARYSSEDTDDDTSITTSKKKKTTASSRKQTQANPIDNMTGTTRFDARTYRALGRILVKGQTENEIERDREREREFVSSV